MLKITTLVAIVASSASIIPPVSAGLWFYAFQTCFSKNTYNEVPVLKVLRANYPNEPCQGTTNTVLVNDTHIVNSDCGTNKVNTVFTKFTGGLKDCGEDGKRVFWPVPTKSSDHITLNEIMNNLPPVDSIVGATAADISVHVTSTPNAPCSSRTFEFATIELIWESCLSLPHKQGSFLSNFTIDTTEFLDPTMYAVSRFNSPDCTNPNKDGLEVHTVRKNRPAVAGGCLDLYRDGRPMIIQIPTWPLDKSSVFPTTKAPYVVKSYRNAIGTIPSDITPETIFSTFEIKTVSDAPLAKPGELPFTPTVPNKPTLVSDNSFDEFPDALGTWTPTPGLPGLGGGNGGKNSGGVVGGGVGAGVVAGMAVLAAVGVLAL
ncbi:hypothetical protein HDU97_007336 [Phlyctochytrium planicorne]|nr:hypothetical protein HDU97_007336 [Phlyctochytrium planicorne]